MCPQERLGRAGWPPETETPRRHVWCIPDLLRNQAHAFSEIFQSAQIRFWVMTSGNLIMPALGRQQGPGASCAPTVKRAAVVTLAITVMVIAPPAWTIGCFDLQHSINNT